MSDSQLEKISKRFLEVREATNLNQKQFAERAKINQSQVSEIEKGKRNITSKILNLLQDNLYVNRYWLEKGEGDMFINSVQNIRQKDEAPYLENMTASAGLHYLTHNSDSPSEYIKIPGAGVDVYINVFGDSMYPKYSSGDIIGIKHIEKDMVFFGNAFVIEMADGEAYIKYILPGKDDDHWLLKSENPNFPSKQFSLDKILKVYKIKTSVTKNSL